MSGGESLEGNRPQAEELNRQAIGRDKLLDALRDKEGQYRALFELMPSSVVLLDANGIVQDANPVFCRGMGYARDELVGLHISRLSQESPERIESSVQRLLAGETLEHEVTNVQKDGSLRYYELRETAITLPDGSKGILAVSNDITDRKRAEREKFEIERQLLHSQKLESLGVLAGGIAHDFNNLLASISGNLELALLDMPADLPARANLREVTDAVRRAADLTRQLLAYSGRGRFVVKDLHLSELVQEMVRLLQVSISKSVDLKLHLAADLPSIQADAAQLQQVVMNLITNASEAMEEKPGTITITTSVGEYGPRELAENRVASRPEPGRYVALEVCDTGCGMDETVLQRLFDPFFTTKFTGRGLGLAAVLGVVQGHRGAIMVQSAPGQGSTLRVLFPAGAVVSTGKTERISRPPEGTVTQWPKLSGTVLVADDEAQVRRFVERALKRLGLTVLTAADGEEALALFKARAGEIAFVLLDLTMPKLDGLKALGEMRRLHPAMKAVLMSGYDSEDISRRYAQEGFDAFLQKPFELDTLAQLAKDMCGTGR